MGETRGDREGGREGAGREGGRGVNGMRPVLNARVCLNMCR